MRTYKVKARYTFGVLWKIKAESRKEAYKIADMHCGCHGPNFTTTLNSDTVDWETSDHWIDKKILKT